MENEKFKGLIMGPNTFLGATFIWLWNLGTSIEVYEDQIILNYWGEKNIIKKTTIDEIMVGDWALHLFHSPEFKKDDTCNVIRFSYTINGVKKTFNFSPYSKKKLIDALKSFGYAIA